MPTPPEHGRIDSDFTAVDPEVDLSAVDVSAVDLSDPAPPRSRRRPGRRVLTGVATVVALTLALFTASALLSTSNRASALTGHPEVLREGCTWDSSGNYVQNCKVWSASQGRYVIVQIRASNGSDSGVYLLDGMRAREDRSGWTTDVQAAKVYDGRSDTTLVMPVGGASSWNTDWDGGAGPDNKTIKQETFLTSELPAYLATNFGVSKSNNAIIGLSMSGGPAVTLAERHPEQFRVVQSMSGYYQTNNPIGALGILASQTLVSNYTNGIVNMWGAPGSQRWADNDASQNVEKLKQNGQTLIISSGNGFLTPAEMAKLSPQDQISAIALEILSAVSTVLMQMQAQQAGANVVILPNYGGHTWDNWGRALGDGKDEVLASLRNNPPVTTTTQVVAADGSRDPNAAKKVTAAVKLAAATATPDPTTLAAAASSTDPSGSPASSSEPSGAAPSSGSSATGSTTPDAPKVTDPATTGTDGPTTPAPGTTTDPAVPSAAAGPTAATGTPAPTTTSTTPVPAP